MFAYFLYALALILVGFSGVLALKDREGWLVFLIAGGVVAYLSVIAGVSR